MKTVASIRESLSMIPQALEGNPPDDSHQGSEGAIETLWPGLENTDDCIPREWDCNSGERISWEDPYESYDSEGIGDFVPVVEVGAEVDALDNALGGTEGEKLKQSVLLKGMDALGWYVPFHYPGLQWGVYISVSGIAYMLTNVFNKLPVAPETKARLAFTAILDHELFHFANEYAMAQAEIAHNEPWVVPAIRFRRGMSPPYFKREECLANAYMLRKFRATAKILRVKGKQTALRAFVKQQPEGYRDAVFVTPDCQNRMLAELAHDYGSNAFRSRHHPLLWNPTTGYDWPGQFPIHPTVDWKFCPIHLVQDGGRLGLPKDWIKCFSKLEGIRESEKFVKTLGSLSVQIQSAWSRTKTKLHTAITSGADFKKWPKDGPNIYSVRLNNNYRAHLEYLASEKAWLALAIGSHKEMGHG
jgi:hypothetical protein